MRCSVQPGRRSSYPRKEPEDNLVLHLKLDNNFDDSSEWKQKVIQPSEALPYFDDRNYYNNNYSTIYGQLTSNPLDNQKVQIDKNISGYIFQTNKKNYAGTDVVKTKGDAHFNKVVLLLQKTNAYGEEDINSSTYRNIAAYTYTQTPTLNKAYVTKSIPVNDNDQGKFDAHSFSFGMSADLIDKQGLVYEGSDNSLDFSSNVSDFTIEFWAKPALLENFSYLETALGNSDNVYARTNSSTTRAEQRTRVDSVIFSSRCFVVGYSLSKGFVVSVPNGDPSTSSAHKDFVLYSNATTEGVNAVSAHDWHHVAFVKDGSQLLLYVNGELSDSLTTSYGSDTGWDGTIDADESLGGSTNNISIGFDAYGIVAGPHEDSALDYIGLLDNIRITKGVARYTESSSNSNLPPITTFPTEPESVNDTDTYVDLSLSSHLGQATSFSVVEDDEDNRGAYKQLTNQCDYADKTINYKLDNSGPIVSAFGTRISPATPAATQNLTTKDWDPLSTSRSATLLRNGIGVIRTVNGQLVKDNSWLNLIHGTADAKMFVTDDFIAISSRTLTPYYNGKVYDYSIRLISLNKKANGLRHCGVGDWEAEGSAHSDTFLGYEEIELDHGGGSTVPGSKYNHVAFDGKTFYAISSYIKSAGTELHLLSYQLRETKENDIARYEVDKDKSVISEGRLIVNNAFDHTRNATAYATSSDTIPDGTSPTDWIKISGNTYPWKSENLRAGVDPGMFAITKNGKSHVYMFAQHKGGSGSPWNSNFYDKEWVLEHWTSENGNANTLYMNVNENPASASNGSKGLYKIRYTDSERSHDGITANSWTNPKVVIGGEDFIFIIDDYPFDIDQAHSGANPNAYVFSAKNTTNVSSIETVRKINVLKINDDGSLTLLKDFDIESDPNTMEGFNRIYFSPNGAFSFYHNGFLYLSTADVQFSGIATDVYRVTGDFNDPLILIEKGINTGFLASHAAGDYLFGEYNVRGTGPGTYRFLDTHAEIVIMSDGTKALQFKNKKSQSAGAHTIFKESRLAHGGRNLVYSATAQGNSILVSGTGVYSTEIRGRDPIDSAEKLNLQEDFTIEAWVKFKGIPKGDDENPGSTIFDWGNLKLTNTSGFFSVHLPDGEVLDYYNHEQTNHFSSYSLKNNLFWHVAVQRRNKEIELWMDQVHTYNHDQHGYGYQTTFLPVAEDVDGSTDVISGIRNTDGSLTAPWSGARAIGSTISGTHNFEGWIDNFKVWDKAIYGPLTTVIGPRPTADGIFTNLDSSPINFYYWYYKNLRRRSGQRLYQYGSTKYLYVNEGESITMWCTFQTIYEPRWSTRIPLPVEITWYKNNVILGTSSQGSNVLVPPNIVLNGGGGGVFGRTGQLSITQINISNGGMYEAWVQIGPRNRPKYFWRYPNLRRIYLMVTQIPNPPPAPKANLRIFECAGNVNLGDDVEITASFSPEGLDWQYFYAMAEVMPPGPYTYVWKNKGRGTQDDTYVRTWRGEDWPGTKLKFKNVRKGIKGPISVEAYDGNGNLVGQGTCPGITIRLPNLEAIRIVAPGGPYSSDANWIIEDWMSAGNWWNRYYGHWYNQYRNNIVSQPGFLQGSLTLDSAASDPNIPELETGGLEYRWYGSIRKNDDMSVENINIDFSSANPTYTRVFEESEAGQISCQIRYKNYPNGRGYDPEGRYQRVYPTSKANPSITWAINAKNCGTPYLYPQNARLSSMHEAISKSYGYWYWTSYFSRITGGNVIEMAGGRESTSYTLNIEYYPCQKVWVPISYWNGRNPRYYGNGLRYGLVKNISYNTGFWDSFINSSTAVYNYRSYDYTNKMLTKVLGPDDDGKSEKIILSNDCGQVEITCNFIKKAIPAPISRTAYTSQTSYERRYLTYTWWADDAVSITSMRTQVTPPRLRRPWISIANMAADCRAYRITVNGQAGAWQTMDKPSINIQGSIYNAWISAPNFNGRYSYYASNTYLSFYMDWVGRPPMGVTWTIKVEFAWDPKDNNFNWDDALGKLEQTFTLNSIRLPNIISNNYRWGWWYWGWRHWGGWSVSRTGQWQRNTWYRPYYYYYNPYYGHTGWHRHYYVYRRPYRGNTSPRMNLGRSIRGGAGVRR